MNSRSINATVASLLGFLHEGPMTGWDLVTTAQHRIGAFWALTQSQVYRELSGMSRDGLIEPDTPGPRDRKPYLITDAGRAAFREWIESNPRSEQIRFPLLLTLAFAEHLTRARLDEIIADHRRTHAERLEDYRHKHALLDTDSRGDRSRLATLEFGLRYETAVLDWMDRLPEILRDRP